MRRSSATSVLAVMVGLGVGGCSDHTAAPVDVEAKMAWIQADTAAVRVYNPTDVAATDAGVLWAVDAPVGSVYRLTPAGEPDLMMGIGDRPPEQIRHPARIAMAPDVGMFIYDIQTREVDLFTFEGNFLWGFRPDFLPSAMAVVRDPVGLEFAIADTTRDTIPRLLVVRTDLRGNEPDTLVSADRGPDALRGVSARAGDVSVVGGDRGMWIWPRASAQDTVFEVAAKPGGRRLVLRSQDQRAVGLLCDVKSGIMWAVLADSMRVRYAAYDVSGQGVLTPDSAFLGERLTPAGFTPHVAVGGYVLGWATFGPRDHRAAAFDMKVDLLPRK